MVKTFSEAFGLPKDRMKLEAGIGDFFIIKIEMKDSKKKYNQQTDDGLMKKAVIPIAYIDIKMKQNGQELKYYSPNKVIVESCKEMLKDSGNPTNGILREPVYIAEVLKVESENKNKYLSFS